MKLDINRTGYIWDGEFIKVKDFTDGFVQELVAIYQLADSQYEYFGSDYSTDPKVGMARMILSHWYPEELI